MSQALLPISRGYILAGALVATGLYLVREDKKAVEPAAPTIAAEQPRQSFAPRPMPTLELPLPSLDDDTRVEIEEELEIEDVHGHAPIEDIGELAMVFEVDGTSYLRLSTEVRAKSHGKRRMVVDGEVHAVVASVAASAVPDQLAKWNGREVLVNGTCRTRVVGFAEVSRASGEPPGMESYWYQAENERPAQEPTWTIKDVTEMGVTLAAELEGCTGTWARSTEYEPAQVARATEAPELETDAIADVIATDGEALQKEWKESGGEGQWDDTVKVSSTTFEHPATGERWIFVQAYEGGGCGEPGLSHMVAYRVGKSGKVRRFTELDYAGAKIENVVDFDGDGQPELVLGEGGYSVGYTSVVDLANTNHDSISVPYNYYGCGC